MLSPYRVLDLSSRGLICGQILADMGADVVQVEPPGGSAARREGPFENGVEAPENSLNWKAYARNKKSIVLNFEDQNDLAVFKRLVEQADFLIESETPGVMAGYGLDYDNLSTINPGLVYVSMTPYGQNGPKSGQAATDLTVLAAGGVLVLYGDRDRAPVRVSVPQAFHHAGAEAAVGALLAHHQRVKSGLGQHVDISAQESVTLATQSNIVSSLAGDKPFERWGGGLVSGPMVIRNVYPAKDGHVTITHIFGSVVGPATQRLMEYVYDEGFCDEATKDKDWIQYGEAVFRGDETIEEFERVKDCVAACTASKTKAELFKAAVERKILLAPIATMEDVIESEQFRAREFIVDVETEGGHAEYPGPFARFSRSPISYRRSAPKLGQHTEEVLSEVRKAAELPLPKGDPNELPLAGVKILDFMWAIAGPAATRQLADYGATVIRIESNKVGDVCRTLRPFKDGKGDSEMSLTFHSMNAGKKMMALNLSSEEAREVVRDLAEWADVVTESFTPRTLKGMGLDYKSLKKCNPELIMLSTCLMGQSGPLANFAGYGNLAAGVAGFFELTGWADRDPAGPYSAYTDYISPRYIAASILAALDYLRRTGHGQHIDLSQAEASIHFLAPALLDCSLNGHVQSRAGNCDPLMAPHGAFQVQGDDRWIAIAVENDQQWHALSGVLGLADDARFETVESRPQYREELESVINEKTALADGMSLEAELVSKGVPVSIVQRSDDSVRDAQLAHRNHFLENGETVIESSRIQLSRTPASVSPSIPVLGRDTFEVLSDILEYDDEQCAQLAIVGALE